jgi:membrane-bound lytic murein transglycosylase D
VLVFSFLTNNIFSQNTSSGRNVTTDALWQIFDRVSLKQQFFEKNVLNLKVPSVIRVADVKIVLTNRARHKVKKEIIRYFNSKKALEKLVSLANIYRPAVDKIFKTNKFPLDLRYIMLLESGCVGNAKSNATEPAVGYWQFKASAAKSVGLKINSAIDERMDLVASTHGFMNYINNCNKKFDNYIFCIMAFYLGLKGGEDMIKKLNIKNSKVLKLDHNWHFYIYTFLAYKLIFAKILPAIPRSKVRLCGAKNCNGLTVMQICKKYRIKPEIFFVLNRWLKVNKIPNDSKNTVIVPVKVK